MVDPEVRISPASHCLRDPSAPLSAHPARDARLSEGVGRECCWGISSGTLLRAWPQVLWLDVPWRAPRVGSGYLLSIIREDSKDVDPACGTVLYRDTITIKTRMFVVNAGLLSLQS